MTLWMARARSSQSRFLFVHAGHLSRIGRVGIDGANEWTLQEGNQLDENAYVSSFLVSRTPNIIGVLGAMTTTA